MSSASSSSDEDAASDEASASSNGQAEEAEAAEGVESDKAAENSDPKESEGVWGHLAHILPHHERQRLERETVERAKEEEKERAAEAAVYVGKPDLPPSWDGGGWAGPRDGHDKDQRYMLRGEARELPDHVYQKWKFLKSAEEFRMPGPGAEKKKKSKKKKETKKEKKSKKDKKKKKNKKEKEKKDKKAGKKKRKNKDS